MWLSCTYLFSFRSTMTVSRLMDLCRCLPAVSVITLPSGLGLEARRATSCLSWKLERTIIVSVRTIIVAPWQVGAAQLLKKWLVNSQDNENVTVASLAQVTVTSASAHVHDYYGPGFNGLGGNDSSTDGFESD